MIQVGRGKKGQHQVEKKMKNRERIWSWFQNNMYGFRQDCADDLNVSYATVCNHVNDIKEDERRALSYLENNPESSIEDCVKALSSANDPMPEYIVKSIKESFFEKVESDSVFIAGNKLLHIDGNQLVLSFNGVEFGVDVCLSCSDAINNFLKHREDDAYFEESLCSDCLNIISKEGALF